MNTAAEFFPPPTRIEPGSAAWKSSALSITLCSRWPLAAKEKDCMYYSFYIQPLAFAVKECVPFGVCAVAWEYEQNGGF